MIEPESMERPKLAGMPGRPRLLSVANTLRARTLYLSGASHADIAQALGITAEQSSRLAGHEKWYALKLANDPESQAIIAEAKQKARELLADWQQEISAGSQELSMTGIGLARDKAERGDARSFKDAASAVQTFVNITRQAEGLGNDSADTGGPNINLFFLPSLAEPEPVNVTPPKPVFRIAAREDVPPELVEEF